MKVFTRWMVLGAVAGAMALTGCQSKERSQEGGGTGGSGSMQGTEGTEGTQGTEPSMGAGQEPSTPPPQAEDPTMDQGMGGSGYDAGMGGAGDAGMGGSGMEPGTGMEPDTGMEGSGGSGSTTGGSMTPESSGDTGSGTVPEPTR